jgi:hypothetical protein
LPHCHHGQHDYAVAGLVIRLSRAGQQPGGSFAYCSVCDPVCELTQSRRVIGPAWAILANLGTGIWPDSPPSARPHPGGSV